MTDPSLNKNGYTSVNLAIIEINIFMTVAEGYSQHLIQMLRDYARAQLILHNLPFEIKPILKLWCERKQAVCISSWNARVLI